jgi:hypothetical protein
MALPGLILLDLAAPTHLFGHCGAPRYAFELASLRPGAVSTSTGFDVVARCGLPTLSGADTIVVPAARDRPGRRSRRSSRCVAPTRAAHA